MSSHYENDQPCTNVLAKHFFQARSKTGQHPSWFPIVIALLCGISLKANYYVMQSCMVHVHASASWFCHRICTDPRKIRKSLSFGYFWLITKSQYCSIRRLSLLQESMAYSFWHITIAALHLMGDITYQVLGQGGEPVNNAMAINPFAHPVHALLKH